MTHYFTLVGANFRPKEDRYKIDQLMPGDRVVLVRDPENPYDANAIQVCFVEPIPNGTDDKGAITFADAHIHIGFVPKELAALFAPVMDRAGVTQYDAKVNTLNGYKPIIEVD